MSHHPSSTPHDSDCGCCDCAHDPALADELAEPSPEEIFGPHVPEPLVPLQAGPVTVYFDREWAFLRRFQVAGREVLRAIYPAVRTATWKTVPPRISNVVIDQQADSFRVTFDCAHHDPAVEVDFHWRGELAGSPDGTVTYVFDGAARLAMKTNRAGLCVLHPPLESAGRPVRIGHVDGSVEDTVFPALISPHQPFFNVRSMTHEAAPGLSARVTMEGEVFETEDQRNWTDASFKTYGGPLAIPLPLHFSAGHTVKQTVRFELSGPIPQREKAAPCVVLTLPEKGTTSLPSIGVRWAHDAAPLDVEALERLRALGLGHVLVDCDVTTAGWQEKLARGQQAARALGAKVLLRLEFTPNHQPAVREAAAFFADAPEELLAVSVVSQNEPSPSEVTLGLVRPAFAATAPNAVIAAAPAFNFADQNRSRPPASAACAPPMCPQVHNFDNESIMENLQGQRVLLETVRSFNPHPIVAGPIALLRRRVHDPRQGSLFAAAWTAGSLAAILPTGLLHSATYHEHAGPRGILGTPCEDVLEGLAGAAFTAETHVSEPAKVSALTVFDADGSRRVLLANLTCEAVAIALPDQPDSGFELAAYTAVWLDA